MLHRAEFPAALPPKAIWYCYGRGMTWRCTDCSSKNSGLKEFPTSLELWATTLTEPSPIDFPFQLSRCSDLNLAYRPPTWREQG